MKGPAVSIPLQYRANPKWLICQTCLPNFEILGAGDSETPFQVSSLWRDTRQQILIESSVSLNRLINPCMFPFLLMGGSSFYLALILFYQGPMTQNKKAPPLPTEKQSFSNYETSIHNEYSSLGRRAQA